MVLAHLIAQELLLRLLPRELRGVDVANQLDEEFPAFAGAADAAREADERRAAVLAAEFERLGRAVEEVHECAAGGEERADATGQERTEPRGKRERPCAPERTGAEHGEGDRDTEPEPRNP